MTTDVVARLRLNGEQFSNEFRSRMSEIEGQARGAATRIGSSFQRMPSMFMPSADFDRMFKAGTDSANRMVAAIDPAFAAQQRYNQSVREANELLALGFLNGERHRQVVASATVALDNATVAQQRHGQMTSLSRAGYQQLSFQIGDVVQQLALGINPAVIFAQQIGQVVQALSLIREGRSASNASSAGGGFAELEESLSGAADATEAVKAKTEQLTAALGIGSAAAEGNSVAATTNAGAKTGQATTTGSATGATNSNTVATGANTTATEANAVATTAATSAKARFATFLAGPWGAAVIGGVTVLALLASKLFDTRSELEKATDELQENAQKAELTRQAQEAFARSIPGIVEAIRTETEALIDQNRTLEENRALRMDQAADRVNQAYIARDAVRGMIQRTRDGPDSFIRPMLLTALEGQLTRLDQAVTRAERGARAAAVPVLDAEVEARLDRATGATRELRQELVRLRQAFESGSVDINTYRDQSTALRRRIRAETDRIQREEREANRRPTEVRDLIRPVTGALLSPFGADRSGVRINGRLVPGRRHQGVDLRGSIGDPVVAPEAGTALVRNSPGGLGLYVEIRADSGARSLLGHLSAANVRSGQRVEAGQLVGLVGNSGNAVGGAPHLHYQRMVNGRWVDPMRSSMQNSSAATAAETAARVTEREADGRERVLESMRQATAQAVEQARLGGMRAQGLDREADQEQALAQVRTNAAERLAQLRQNLDQMRESGDASQADIQRAETAVAAQEQVTAGLEEQLRLYEQQGEAFGRMLVLHRQDGKLSEEELAAERAASEQKQQTLERARSIATTVADTQKIGEAMVRTEHQLNSVIEDGNHKREQAREHAEALAQEQQQALDEMKEEMVQRQEEQLGHLADLYRDLFNGRTGDIVDRFKDGMLDAIAQIAAAWTLAQITGQDFNLGGTLQGMQGNPIAGLLGGLFGGAGKGGAMDLGSMMAGPFGMPMMPGMTGGAGGLMAGIGSAMPYIGAAFAAFGLLQSLGVFSSTKRGSATLGYAGGSLGAGATRGNSQDYIAASSSAMDSVGGSLERIAEALGGTVTGAGSVSLGQRDGNWRGDPTGRGITKTKKGAIDFGDDQEAAIRWAISEALRDGVIGGISDAAKRILQSGKDLEKAIDKAVMIESIPKLLKKRLDPVGAALDELDEKWEKIIDALREGSATAEQMAEAQQLYRLELQETIDRTAAASASLKEFLDGLKMGPNSPYSLRQQEEEARAALQPYLDAIAAGEAIDQDKYQSVAQTYLDIERQLYGSTGQFFAAMDEIMAATSKAIERLDSAVPIRTAADPFIERTATNTDTMTDQLGVLQEQGASTLEILGAIQTLLGNSGSGFVGGGMGFTAVAA